MIFLTLCPIKRIVPMSSQLHIALYGYSNAGVSAFQSAELLINLLRPHCASIECFKDFYQKLSCGDDVKPVESPSDTTDIIISIGGDGAFLHAVSWEGKGKIPIAGLNGGHLGYLTGWTLKEIDNFAQAIIEGNYKIEERSLIEVESESLVPDFWPYALNEASILKESSATMISVKAEKDGMRLTEYDADGLIVSTPTGSTGYNLSVGGPILEPELQAWVVSPVAAHSLNMRPLVISDTSVLKLSASSRTENVMLSLDGRTLVIPCSEPVYLRKAPFKMKVIRKKDATFLATLREKLYWGLSESRS